jgi:uncharacterized delta-60 repeat protein
MKKNRAFVFTGLLFLGSLHIPNSASASAGSLDTAFGTGGMVVTGIPAVQLPFAAALDAALDAEGNIVVVASNGAGTLGRLARFLPTGALDSTFGNKGIALVPFPLASAAFALAIQSNGQIVVGGTTNGAAGASAFALARYNSNGALDSTFGSGGEVITSFANLAASLQVVLVQPNGDMVASGQFVAIGLPYVYPSGAALARYTSNGELDVTFGTAGTVTLPGVAELTALALVSNGQILFTSNSIGLALNANGSAYGTVSGIVAIAHEGSMDFQPNGELVGAVQQATQRDSETTAVLVTRTYANGSADSTFTAPLFDFNSGTEIEEFNQSSPLALSIASAGQILVGGSSSTNATVPVFGLARLNSNGSLDTTFGSGGVVTTAFAHEATVEKLLVQSDGKIVAVGSAGTDLALARYLGQ